MRVPLTELTESVVGALADRKALAERRTARTLGLVVDQDERTLTNDGVPYLSYHAVVRFWADGREYTFVSSWGSTPPSYPEGAEVPVFYDPIDPTNATIPLPPRSLFLILAVFGLVVGVFLWAIRR